MDGSRATIQGSGLVAGSYALGDRQMQSAALHNLLHPLQASETHPSHWRRPRNCNLYASSEGDEGAKDNTRFHVSCPRIQVMGITRTSNSDDAEQEGFSPMWLKSGMRCTTLHACMESQH